MTPSRALGGGSWAAYRGARPPEGILFIEAFGRLSENLDLRDAPPGEGALWSVFRTRAEMMGWSSTGESELRTHEVRWSVHEAELDSRTSSPRIGWAQVGLRAGVSPARVIPALVQCLDDALRRFGATEVSGLQLTASHLQPSDGTSASEFASWLGWFSAVPGAEVEALVSTDAGLLGHAGDPRWLDAVELMSGGPFRFGPLVGVQPGARDRSARGGARRHAHAREARCPSDCRSGPLPRPRGRWRSSSPRRLPRRCARPPLRFG